MAETVENGGVSVNHPGMPPAIELRGVSKRFGPVLANDDVSLKVEQGVIHGIIGENGAGKSTLMSILYGFYEADRGEILIRDKPLKIRTTQDAISAGIGMVHQHFMLVDTFTVLENVILGAEAGPLLVESLDAARTELDRLEREYGLEVAADAVVGDLPVGVQQRVEILKALFRGARILILDEPTGVLTPQETDRLFQILSALKEQGVTILLITHKLREIMAITDTVSVMRGGRMVAHRPTEATNESELAELMVGRKVLLRVEKSDPQIGDVKLDVSEVSVVDEKNVPRVDKVTFNVRAGEIVGIAGVSGNGQSELLSALSGITPITQGRFEINGRQVTPGHPIDPHAMRQIGVAHVPEDRLRMGLVRQFSAMESFMLGYQDDPAYNGPVLFDLPAVRRDCEAKMQAYDVRPPDPDLRTANFSGGNQQKIVLARDMERAPEVLLVGQPTRGVDIGAIEFIHKSLIEMRDRGSAVLLVSVELDEVMSLSDRILVMFDGHIVGEVLAADADERALGLMMANIVPEGIANQRRDRAMTSNLEAPRWVGYLLIPLINVMLAFFFSGLIVLAIGENPFTAMGFLVEGAFGSINSIGYTLYYATNIIFTGLAVAIAFHAGLFNIGGEGQAYIGGLGVGLICLATDQYLPFILILPLGILFGALFGAGWAFVPAYLQAKRGSHIVITTIMFNFIAGALMNYLLVNILIKPGQMSPESREFAESAWLPFFHDMLGWFGVKVGATPLNAAFNLGAGMLRTGLAADLADPLGLCHPRCRSQRNGGRLWWR